MSARRYLYNGWNLIAELDGAGTTLLRSFVWGLDVAGSLEATGGVGALLQIVDHSAGKTLFVTYDGNGNVATLLDAGNGDLMATYEYSPYGELLRCEGSYAKANPFRFSTKFMDDDAGLVDYGHRFYSASLGRFINRDPIEESGGINLYGYCRNDPIDKWDYIGLVPPGEAVNSDPINLPKVEVTAPRVSGSNPFASRFISGGSAWDTSWDPGVSSGWDSTSDSGGSAANSLAIDNNSPTGAVNHLTGKALASVRDGQLPDNVAILKGVGGTDNMKSLARSQLLSILNSDTQAGVRLGQLINSGKMFTLIVTNDVGVAGRNRFDGGIYAWFLSLCVFYFI